jgi:hypothetical protein
MAFVKQDLDAVQDYVAGHRHRLDSGRCKSLLDVARDLRMAPARIQRMLRHLRSFAALQSITEASAARYKAAFQGTVKAREVRAWQA